MAARALLALWLALLFSFPAFALEAENLLVAMPPGYKVGYTNHTAKGVITEMVPAGETVETWTEMVTVQIFFGMHDSVSATACAWRSCGLRPAPAPRAHRSAAGSSTATPP